MYVAPRRWYTAAVPVLLAACGMKECNTLRPTKQADDSRATWHVTHPDAAVKHDSYQVGHASGYRPRLSIVNCHPPQGKRLPFLDTSNLYSNSSYYTATAVLLLLYITIAVYYYAHITITAV